jgi:cytochrome P450
VLRAFTSRRIGAMEPEIAALCERLIGEFPSGPFDLLDAFGRVIPVVVIARLLGVPTARADDLLRWSNAMVAMYQARPDAGHRGRGGRGVARVPAFVIDDHRGAAQGAGGRPSHAISSRLRRRGRSSRPTNW